MEYLISEYFSETAQQTSMNSIFDHLWPLSKADLKADTEKSSHLPILVSIESLRKDINLC